MNWTQRNLFLLGRAPRQTQIHCALSPLRLLSDVRPCTFIIRAITATLDRDDALHSALLRARGWQRLCSFQSARHCAWGALLSAICVSRSSHTKMVALGLTCVALSALVC